MLHRPEKVLQIGVHDPLPSALNLLPHFAHGVLRRSPSPISEVGFVEHRLEDRLQPIEQRLLAHPVVYRRDDQRELHLSPVCFWDGLKSAILSTPCTVSALKCSKNGV